MAPEYPGCAVRMSILAPRPRAGSCVCTGCLWPVTAVSLAGGTWLVLGGPLPAPHQHAASSLDA